MACLSQKEILSFYNGHRFMLYSNYLFNELLPVFRINCKERQLDKLTTLTCKQFDIFLVLNKKLNHSLLAVTFVIC